MCHENAIVWEVVVVQEMDGLAFVLSSARPRSVKVTCGDGIGQVTSVKACDTSFFSTPMSSLHFFPRSYYG